MKGLIYKDTARLIIDSARSKEEMLKALNLTEPVEQKKTIITKVELTDECVNKIAEAVAWKLVGEEDGR